MSIQTEIERINNAKAGIAEAISEKGVTVAEGTSIDDFPGLVRSIPQNGTGGESVNEIFWVTCDLDQGKVVKGKGRVNGLDAELILFDLVSVGGYSGQLIFAVFLRTLIQGQAVCLYINLKMRPDNSLENDIMLVNTTSM